MLGLAHVSFPVSFPYHNYRDRGRRLLDRRRKQLGTVTPSHRSRETKRFIALSARPFCQPSVDIRRNTLGGRGSRRSAATFELLPGTTIIYTVPPTIPHRAEDKRRKPACLPIDDRATGDVLSFGECQSRTGVAKQHRPQNPSTPYQRTTPTSARVLTESCRHARVHLANAPPI